MPWQQFVADVALEVDPATGKLAYREVGLTVPRQSGKTTLVLANIFTRALSAPRQNIRYTAQTGSDARKKLVDDWLPALEDSSFKRRGLFEPRMTNGHEALKFKNGSHAGLVATVKKSGHGGTIHQATVDEAFAQPDARIEQALKPAMSTIRGAQFWVISTAGTPDESPYLLGKVEHGRELAASGARSGVCYFEWSPPEDADPAAEETWWSCMPALGITQTVEVIRADFASMPLNEFERAYLNRWKAGSVDPVIPVAAWIELVDFESRAMDPVCLSFDVTPDRSASSIAAAGRRKDGKFHVEVIRQGRGTGWVAKEVARLVERHHPSAVICDPSGPAGSLLPDLVGLRVDAIPVNSNEHGQACGILFDAVDQRQVHHLGTPEVTAAIDGAVKRPVGDGLWAWGRKNSGVDISPLVAITLALWGAQKKPAKSRFVSFNDL
jgi:phage terminase large subunit-like protein